jgi:predicted DNA-binding protein with PD1-like motif
MLLGMSLAKKVLRDEVGRRMRTKLLVHFQEQVEVEVVSLIGDVALEDGKPRVHAHATLGKPGGITAGGHFLEGYVRPTLEVILSQSPKHLERQFDPQSGIALIRI